MTRPSIPPDIAALAEARRDARERQDWAEADRLRAEIEAAGWKVADRGSAYHLSPAHAPDVIEPGRIRYGTSGAVPSRLADPSTGLATVVLHATDHPAELARVLAGMRPHAPAGTQVVIVAESPSAEQEAALLDQAGPAFEPIAGVAPEIVWLSARIGHAAALNAGIRRAGSATVILLDTSLEPVGDFVTPLVATLADATVALAGGWGRVSGDLRRFEEAPAGDVDAIDGSCLAFRRADYSARGPLDEGFRLRQHLDTWWSLILRDEGEDRPPRRARGLDGLPLVHHEDREESHPREEVRTRQAKRNFYRLMDRFGSRRDLLVAGRRVAAGSRADRP